MTKPTRETFEFDRDPANLIATMDGGDLARVSQTLPDPATCDRDKIIAQALDVSGRARNVTFERTHLRNARYKSPRWVWCAIDARSVSD